MIHERIYELRRQRGFSQEQLVEHIGVSRQTISKWESGASVPELEKLIALSRCFSVTVDALIGDVSDMTLERQVGQEQNDSPARNLNSCSRRRAAFGMALWVTGLMGFAVFVVLVMFCREAAQQLADSFTIHLNGVAVLILFSLVMMGTGFFLMFSKR